MTRFGSFVLTGLLVLPAVASAGAVPATASITAGVLVDGIGNAGNGLAGGAANVNIGRYLKIDSTTGNAFIDANIGDSFRAALGVFSVEAAGADAPLVFDRATGRYAAPTTVVRWSSFARQDGSFNNVDAVGETSATTISFAMAANVDPFMSYGLSVRNNSNATNHYTFTFAESLVPAVAGLYNVYADISGSLVNGVAGSALNLGTTVGSTIQKVHLMDSSYLISDNAGVDVGLAQLNPGAPAGSITYSGNGLQAANLVGNSGIYAYDSWEFKVDFSLSGGRDVATLSGFAEITPIPEPETYALFFAGLMAVGMMVRNRARA